MTDRETIMQSEINRLRNEVRVLAEELSFYQNARVVIDEYGRFWLAEKRGSNDECRPINGEISKDCKLENFVRIVENPRGVFAGDREAL